MMVSSSEGGAGRMPSSEGGAGRMPSSEGGAVRSEMGSGRPWLNKSLASVREQVGYIFLSRVFLFVQNTHGTRKRD